MRMRRGHGSGYSLRESSIDPRSGSAETSSGEQVIQRAVHDAVRCAGIAKAATPHTLRHSSPRTFWSRAMTFARWQELMGHANVKTTMIYTHVSGFGGSGVRSPLDALGAPEAVSRRG